MWIYEQKTGEITRGLFTVTGYSGHDTGKNNPAMQHVRGVGPIPVGTYAIGAPHDTDTHGPFVLALTPRPDNEMFGRSGFLIHGDSVTHPGGASRGCIILPRAAREEVWNSGDHQLQVVSGFDEHEEESLNA